MNVKKLTAILLVNPWFWVACSGLLILTALVGVVLYGVPIAGIAAFCFIGTFILLYNFEHPAWLPDRYPCTELYQWLIGLIAAGFFCAAWYIGLVYVGPVFVWFAVAACLAPIVIHKTLLFWGIQWIR